MKDETKTQQTDEMEMLDLDDVEAVTGGSIRDVIHQKTEDISDDIINKI